MPSEILYTDSTDYLLGGALTLKNGRIDMFQFDEGYCQATRYNATQDNFMFYYYDRDHLGNVRQVTKAIGSNGTVVQTMNYYPSALRRLFLAMAESKQVSHCSYGLSKKLGAQFCDGSAATSDFQQYKYNGKELDKMHGLNTYDYGARQYYSILGRWDRMDPLCEKYYSTSPFAYCANNPVNAIDPDGKKGVLVHGTWSDHTTWEHPNDIKAATKNLFNDGELFKESFDWSGDNTKEARTEGALKLIGYIQSRILSGELKDNDPITFIGHSHGGNVCIEAINMMSEMSEFKGRQINLLTINTPVRDDYQLSGKAQQRVNYVNVYNPKDPVQAIGGSSLFGEIGPARRTFPRAKNIEVNNPQGVIGVQWVQGYDSNSHSATSFPVLKFNWTDDFHNSHNQVSTWINKTR